MPKIALSLTGGGLSGALYQVGALAALEDSVEGLRGDNFSLYIGSGSGASIAAALAGGVEVSRLYRALLDPMDNFLPLERKHIFAIDWSGWSSTSVMAGKAGYEALLFLYKNRGSKSGLSLPPHLAEQLDRLFDTLPPGLFTLKVYERFLAEFFLRRSVPNTFGSLERLRIAAQDIDTGERAVFDAKATPTVPVSLACAASLALPLFFSPVRVDGRFYVDGTFANVSHVDLATQDAVDLVIVVNPMVPVSLGQHATVPTGHGDGTSVRDKGLLWLYSQALRSGAHARLEHEIARERARSGTEILLLQPERQDAQLFLRNPAAIDSRRKILEFAYRSTRERLEGWLQRYAGSADRMGWEMRAPKLPTFEDEV